MCVSEKIELLMIPSSNPTSLVTPLLHFKLGELVMVNNYISNFTNTADSHTFTSVVLGCFETCQTHLETSAAA